MENNVIAINGWWENGQRNDDTMLLTLLADGFRDRGYLDWLLANKLDESETTEDFNDLMK